MDRKKRSFCLFIKKKKKKKKKKMMTTRLLQASRFSPCVCVCVWRNPFVSICNNLLIKGVFVSWKVVSGKPLSKLSCVYLSLEKLVNRKYFPVNGKHFPVKVKFSLVSRKVFSFYFRRKTLSGSGEKFRNVILFADYIKFDPQTFDCYIYFVLNIFFSISSLII
jgi:hypothetical protein